MPPESTVETQEPTVRGWMNAIKTELPTPPAPEAKKEEPAKVPPSVAAGAEKETSKPTTSTGSTTAESVKPAMESGKTTSEQSTKPESEDEAQEKWPRSGDDWAKYKAKDKERTSKLKADIAAREAKAAELETKLKERETELATVKEKSGAVDPEVQSKLERLEKENKEYSDRLAVTAVTAHPKFVAYFKNKVDNEINLAKAIVGPDKADEVAKVLLMADGEYKTAKLEEVMGDLTPLQSQRLTNRIDALENIETERRSEIARAEENRESMAKEQSALAEKRSSEGKRVFGEVVKSMQDPKNGNPILQLRDGDEAWNTQVKQSVAQAEKLFLGGHNLSTADLVKASLNASTFPVLLKSYEQDIRERDDRIGKLEAQVKELSAATPVAGKGASAEVAGSGPAPEAKIKHGMSPMEASSAWVRSIKADRE